MSLKTRTDQLMAMTLLIVFASALGWLGGFAWQHRATINRLWFEASEQRYLTMTGDIGPVTYVVALDDYAAVEQAALDLDGVLGIEVHEYPSLAAIAFRTADSPAIERIAALDTVTSMTKKFVPMICH